MLNLTSAHGQLKFIGALIFRVDLPMQQLSEMELVKFHNLNRGDKLTIDGIQYRFHSMLDRNEDFNCMHLGITCSQLGEPLCYQCVTSVNSPLVVSYLLLVNRTLSDRVLNKITSFFV